MKRKFPEAARWVEKVGKQLERERKLEKKLARSKHLKRLVDKLKD